MRNFYALLLFVILLSTFLGYAYHENPVGCWKVYYSVDELIASLLPGHHPADTDQTASSSQESPTKAAPEVASVSPTAPVPATATSNLPPPAPASPSLTNTVPVAVTPAPPEAVKLWTPPELIPARENWTWTTTDGKTYDNVVIDKIDPDTVSITHSRGVAQISTSTLPADIQKQLNYDPVAVAATLAEAKREKDHSFYHFAELADAQAAARSLHLPLAWMNGDEHYAEAASYSQSDSTAQLTATALTYLDKQAIVIFMVGNTDLAALPALVRDQLFILDDGPMPGGHHFYPPKIVLTDPDVTKVYGRVSNTQMKAERGDAIVNLLKSVK